VHRGKPAGHRPHQNLKEGATPGQLGRHQRITNGRKAGSIEKSAVFYRSSARREKVPSNGGDPGDISSFPGPARGQRRRQLALSHWVPPAGRVRQEGKRQKEGKLTQSNSQRRRKRQKTGEEGRRKIAEGKVSRQQLYTSPTHLPCTFPKEKRRTGQQHTDRGTKEQSPFAFVILKVENKEELCRSHCLRHMDDSVHDDLLPGVGGGRLIERGKTHSQIWKRKSGKLNGGPVCKTAVGKTHSRKITPRG